MTDFKWVERSGGDSRGEGAENCMETILVVDDEADVRSMTRDALVLNGYQVLDAGGGEEALRLEETWTEPIHLLLSDIVMPGLSGPDLARRFALRRPRAKLLFMSAFTLVDFAHHTISVDLGVPILAKPFTLDALERKVRELLAPSPFVPPPGTSPSDTTVPRATRWPKPKPVRA